MSKPSLTRMQGAGAVVGDPGCELRFRQVVNQWGHIAESTTGGTDVSWIPFRGGVIPYGCTVDVCRADQCLGPSLRPRIQRAIAVEPPLRHEKSTSLKVDVDLVLVPVTVTDRQHRLVLGLEKDSFTVFERGNQQVICHFSSEDAPVSLGIIFDTSSRMYGKMEQSREAVVQLLRSSYPNDEFFLIGFANRPELLVDFTGPVDAIQALRYVEVVQLDLQREFHRAAVNFADSHSGSSTSTMN